MEVKKKKKKKKKKTENGETDWKSEICQNLLEEKGMKPQ